jgi:hypothetical protein
MGSSSRSVEMAIIDTSEGSALQTAIKLLASDNAAEFISISKNVAHMLTKAQTSRAHPGGLIMVFTGTTGIPSKRYVGFLKAEPQTGFRQQLHDGQSVLEFIKKLFLTPDAKVYKIGVFVEQQTGIKCCSETPIGGFSSYLFDANMTSRETIKAATYFYQTFLGLRQLAENAQITRKFVEVTRQFIDSMNIDEEAKLDLRSALITYVKTNTNPTISVAEFGSRYLPDEDTQDAYEAYGKKRSLPDRAFKKDLTECNTLLRRRRIKFANDVQLTAPADQFNELIEIEKIPGNEVDEMWTQLTIKSRFLGEK